MNTPSRSQLMAGAAAGVLAGAGLGLSRHVLPVVYPHMQAALELGAGQMGMLATAYFLAYMFFAYFWGHITDRIGAGRVLALCLLITASSMALVGWSTHFGLLVLLSLLMGAGGGGLFVPGIAALVRIFSTGQRGKAISIFFIGEGGIVLVLGQMIPLIALSLSWRWSWLLSAALCAALALPAYFLLASERTASDAEPPSFSLGIFKDLLRLPALGDKRLVWLSTVYHLHGWARGAMVTFVVAYLVEHGFTHQAAGNGFALLGLGFVPGSFLAGYLVDRFQRLVLSGLVAVELAALGLVVLVADAVVVNCALVVLGGCLTGIPTAVGALNAEISPADTYGQTLGWLTLCLGTGTMLSPVICGYLADFSDTLSAPLYFALLVLLAALPFAAMLENSLRRDR